LKAAAPTFRRIQKWKPKNKGPKQEKFQMEKLEQIKEKRVAVQGINAGICDVMIG
jgi:hypothetical protein